MRRHRMRGAAVALGTVLLACCTSGGPPGSSLSPGSTPTNGPKIGSSSIGPEPTDSSDSQFSVLARPLKLPKLTPRDRCPTSDGRSYRNSQFGGIALGHGAVLPLV